MDRDLTCPLCRKLSARQFETGGYWIRRCQSCGHEFLELTATDGHVDRLYGDEYFSGGGAGYSDYRQEERLLVARGQWYARRIAQCSQPGRMLDVGAAAGFTLGGFRAAGWQTFGVEPNGRMAAFARQHMNIEVEQAAFENWQTNQTFDLITMLQVLPHFVDPAGAMRKATALLRPGGHLLIETWDRESWTARVFGHGWHEYSPPSVLHWFSRGSLKELAACMGLQQVAGGRPSKWIDARHAKSVLQHKQATSLASRLLLTAAHLVPDRAAVPYPFDDLFWVLFVRT